MIIIACSSGQVLIWGRVPMLQYPFPNSAILLCSLLVAFLALSLQVILTNHIAIADPWDVKFSKKWGSTCLLSSNISCVDSMTSTPPEPEKIGDGKFWGIWGITSDESAIYTADVLNHRVQKFDSDGSFIKKWGKEGVSNGEFTKPSGIVADSQYVYVADHSNRIQVFDKEGQFVKVIGSSGSNPGQLNHPEDVDIDSSGRVYVADSGNHRIQIYYPNNLGGIVWGSQGTGIGQFNYPQGISVPSPGHVYVADSHNNRIQYFQLSSVCPQGTTAVQAGVCFVKEWGEPGSADGQFKRPSDVSISDGIVYVVDANNNRIQLFTKEGTFIKKFGSECLVKTGLRPSEGCKEPDGNGQFKYPAGVTVRSNTIFVADNFNDRVQVFNIEPGALPMVGVKADAGEDQTVDSGEKVTLNGELSKPDDGSLKFQWRQTGGSQNVDLTNPDTAKPTFDTPQVTQDTTFNFELKVTDNNNQVNTDMVSVNVVGMQQNQKPYANAGEDETVFEGESVGLDGGASKDNDGTIESYQWQANQCDNNEPNGSIDDPDPQDPGATFVAPQIAASSALCTVELKVTDNQGATDTDTVKIMVKENL